MSAHEDSKRVIVGRVSGLFGVQGWVKVFSHTAPRENIINYSPWQLKLGSGWKELTVKAGRAQGRGLIAQLEGIADRDAAAALVGAEIAVCREQLPAAAEDEYYWADLEGLRVITRDGVELGIVSHLLATGANDVLVVRGERERLIPYIPGQVVVDVDLNAGTLRVDWDPEF